MAISDMIEQEIPVGRGALRRAREATPVKRKASDMARLPANEELPTPPPAPRPRRRPARSASNEPSADELNATELLNARERDRVSAYKSGGMVRGGGCEVRGKTRGRMT